MLKIGSRYTKVAGTIVRSSLPKVYAKQLASHSPITLLTPLLTVQLFSNIAIDKGDPIVKTKSLKGFINSTVDLFPPHIKAWFKATSPKKGLTPPTASERLEFISEAIRLLEERKKQGASVRVPKAAGKVIPFKKR